MKKNPLDKIIQMIREDVPTNAMAHGKIAGSAEAGDGPPVRKRKRYIYTVSMSVYIYIYVLIEITHNT